MVHILEGLKKQRRSIRFTVRVTPDDLARWETEAVKQGFNGNVSAWLRSLASKQKEK